MQIIRIEIITALLALLLITGCCSSAQIQIAERQFPTVVSKPKPVSAAIVFDNQFRDFVAAPNKAPVSK